MRVGVIGAGYWGPNIVRNLHEAPGAEAVAVADLSPERLDAIRKRFPAVRVTTDYRELVGDPSIDAICIVTPVGTHRRLAEEAFAAGKHVFVEKPLATSVTEAASLVELADQVGRVLATGHVYVYHPAVVYLRQLARDGALGRLCYAVSDRVNAGPPASDLGVIWDLAVHDVAILLSILDQKPVEVAAEGHRFAQRAVFDVAFLRLVFPDGFVARIHVSWLSPARVRRLFVAGTAGSAIFDEVRSEEPLTVVGAAQDSRVGATDADAHELNYGPVGLHTPILPTTLPLTAECLHFLESVRTGHAPIADGRAGLAVVRVLEAAEQSAVSGGISVQIGLGVD